MAKTKPVDELDEENPNGSRSFGNLWGLLKGKKPAPIMDDDEDDEDDGGAPSAEDAVKNQAPSAAKPPAGDDDEDDEGDDEEDQGGDQDEDDEDDEGDDEDQDGEAGAGQAPPPGGGSDDDAALRRKVLQRAKDNPDFFKSLVEGDDAQHVIEAIDASDTVAYIVQTFSDQLDAERSQTATVVKSLGAQVAELQKALDLTMDALAKSLEQQADILKGQRRQATLLKGLDAQPAGLAPTGTRGAKAPARFEPADGDGAVVEDEGLLKSRLTVGLRKAMTQKLLPGETATALMVKVDSAGGPQEVDQILKSRYPKVHELIAS